MAAGGLEGLEYTRQVVGVVREGGDRVEVGALVVGDICGVMAKKVPASLRDQGEEPVVAERAAVDRPADLHGHGYAQPADFIGVLVGISPEDSRDLMASGGQLLDEPRSREGAPTCEQDFHNDSARLNTDQRQMPCRIKVTIVAVFLRDHSWLTWPHYCESRLIPADAPLVFRCVEFIDKVKRLGVVGQREKPVCEALGYVHHATVFGRQLGAKALAKSGRVLDVGQGSRRRALHGYTEQPSSRPWGRAGNAYRAAFPSWR